MGTVGDEFNGEGRVENMKGFLGCDLEWGFILWMMGERGRILNREEGVT